MKMKNNLVTEKILGIFTENLTNDLDIKISLDTRLDELNINSIDFIRIIVELEGVFDFEFETEMLLYEAFTDIESIQKYVIQRLKKN